jgi:hypothetical protein
MDSVVISVRVNKEIKAKLEREGINVEQFIKNALMYRAKQAELKKAVEGWKETIKRSVKPSKSGFAEKAIREGRDAGH